MFVDSHCHLDMSDRSGGADAVLARARAAGLGRFLAIGTNKRDLPGILDIAHANEDVFCSVGTHPEEAGKPEEVFSQSDLAAAAQDPKIVALGETGLDYFYDDTPLSVQRENFAVHISAARQLDLPLIVHSRQAEDDTAALLQEGAAGQGAAPLRGVLHCFSSARPLALAALDLGFFISLSGILTFKKSDELRTIVRDLPLDRLLLETDSPFLAPVPYRGKPCEPAFLIETAKVLAELKGVTLAEIACVTTENFFTLFTKVPRA